MKPAGGNFFSHKDWPSDLISLTCISVAVLPLCLCSLQPEMSVLGKDTFAHPAPTLCRSPGLCTHDGDELVTQYHGCEVPVCPGELRWNVPWWHGQEGQQWKGPVALPQSHSPSAPPCSARWVEAGRGSSRVCKMGLQRQSPLRLWPPQPQTNSGFARHRARGCCRVWEGSVRKSWIWALVGQPRLLIPALLISSLPLHVSAAMGQTCSPQCRDDGQSCLPGHSSALASVTLCPLRASAGVSPALSHRVGGSAPLTPPRMDLGSSGTLFAVW